MRHQRSSFGLDLMAVSARAQRLFLVNIVSILHLYLYYMLMTVNSIEKISCLFVVLYLLIKYSSFTVMLNDALLLCQSLCSFMLVCNASVEPWWRYYADVEVWQALRRAESKPWSTANHANRSSEKVFSGESTSLDTDYGTQSKLNICHPSLALNQDS